jgi:hypothetical protein
MKPNTCLKSAALVLALACTCLAFKLKQFRAAIECDANEAVIMDGRNDTKHILQDLGRRP